VGTAATPGRAGAFVGTRYSAPRNVKVGGVIVSTTSFADVWVKWSALCAAHETATPCQLRVGRDGWFLMAQATSVDDTSRGIDSLNWEISYLASDPYFYSDTLSTYTLATAGDSSFTTNSTVSALPAISLVFPSGSAVGTVRITSANTGESILITASPGETIVIDSRTETIVGPLAVDRTYLLQSGGFVSLTPASNTLTVTAAGCSLTSASIAWRDRSL